MNLYDIDGFWYFTIAGYTTVCEFYWKVQLYCASGGHAYYTIYTIKVSDSPDNKELQAGLQACSRVKVLTFGTWQRQTSLPLFLSTLNNITAALGASDLNCLRA